MSRKETDQRLVSVVLELVRTADIEAEVLGLNGCKGGELDTDGSQMGTSDLLIESLGEHAVEGENEVSASRAHSVRLKCCQTHWTPMG